MPSLLTLIISEALSEEVKDKKHELARASKSNVKQSAPEDKKLRVDVVAGTIFVTSDKEPSLDAVAKVYASVEGAKFEKVSTAVALSRRAKLAAAYKAAS